MLICHAGSLVLTVALGIGFKPVLDRLVGPAANVLLQGFGYAQGVLGR